MSDGSLGGHSISVILILICSFCSYWSFNDGDDESCQQNG